MTTAESIELLPTRAVFRRGEDVIVEVRGDRAGAAELTVFHLGELIDKRVVDPTVSAVDLGPLHLGGYGVDVATAGGTTARTAVQVLDDPRRRLRYGFVADYRRGRDVSGVVDNARRLHLTAIQFYDWAYRHADLVGGGEEFTDPLGQPVALDTVRRLVAGLHAAEISALGYAAVYAVGPEEWPRWADVALLRADGEPYALGDILRIVDPAAPAWTAHLVDDLRSAVDAVDFDGFHLDQYGYPRIASRPDGAIVDVATSFATLLDRVRASLPAAQLVFNNVNDFPTWVTGRCPQDAVYIEVWPPHTTLASLATLVERARAAGGGKPVVAAAYQSVYARTDAEAADLTTAFTMATLFSHGATQLLAGETDRVLVDPYYVHNHVVEASTADLLRRWYDFLVEHDELLLDSGIVDVTTSWVGPLNDGIEVSFDGAGVSDAPEPGTVWRRVTAVGGVADRLVVHLINLVGQADTAWDEPRRPLGDPGRGTLRVQRPGSHVARVRVADPDRGGRLNDVEVTVDGEFASARLPPPRLWQVVLVEATGQGWTR